MPRSKTTWQKGQSGNPDGRTRTPYGEMEYGRRLRMALRCKVEVPVQLDPVKKAEAEAKGKPLKATRTTDEMGLVIDKVISMAKEGNSWAIEHVAMRIDGKVPATSTLPPTPT